MLWVDGFSTASNKWREMFVVVLGRAGGNFSSLCCYLRGSILEPDDNSHSLVFCTNKITTNSCTPGWLLLTRNRKAQMAALYIHKAHLGLKSFAVISVSRQSGMEEAILMPTAVAICFFDNVRLFSLHPSKVLDGSFPCLASQYTAVHYSSFVTERKMLMCFFFLWHSELMPKENFPVTVNHIS